MAKGFLGYCLSRHLPWRSILDNAAACSFTASSVRTFCRHSKHFSTGTRPFTKTRELNVYPSSSASKFCSLSPSAVLSFPKFGFIGWYLEMVKSRPVITKSITCSLIYIAADTSSQAISHPSTEPFDFLRTLRMAGYGLIILGPSLHFWFNFVSRVVPKRDTVSTLKKITMGQMLYGPAMTTVFFSLNAALQGENYMEIVARLKRDLLPTMINGVLYWPFCDFVTFKFVPVHLQPLVSNSFSFLWTVYITYMAGLEPPAPAHEM